MEESAGERARSEVMLEQIRDEFRLLAEGHVDLDRRIDRVALESADRDASLDKKIDLVVVTLSRKIDRLADGFGVLDRRVDCVDQKVDRVDLKIDRVDQKVDRVDLKIDRVGEELAKRMDGGFAEMRAAFSALTEQLQVHLRVHHTN